MSNGQLFVSAVSDEFRLYRGELRQLLTRRNVTVHVQEDFVPTGTETLEKLDDYIKNSDLVLHLVGDMTGAWAEPPSHEFRTRYPDLYERLPPLKRTLQTGKPQLSYTQWEAYLALYHRKDLLIARPLPEAVRDQKYLTSKNNRNRQRAQRAHLKRLKVLGCHSEIDFKSVDNLAAKTLRSRQYVNLLAKNASDGRASGGLPKKIIKIAKMKDVKRWGWNAETLLEKLVDLDHKLIGSELTDDAEGTAENWAPIFSKNQYSWRLAFDKPRNILGYWEMHALVPEAFEMAKRGKLVDGQLSLEMIDILIPGIRMHYNIYFSMIGVTPEAHDKYQNRVYGELVNSIFDVLDELSIERIFLREIVAAAWTSDGERLCHIFGMKKTGNCHTKNSNVNIYSGSIFDALKQRPDKFQNLHDRYVQRFKGEGKPLEYDPK
jgi:hypothetical protein